jgi:hypothetical protein
METLLWANRKCERSGHITLDKISKVRETGNIMLEKSGNKTHILFKISKVKREATLLQTKLARGHD